MGGTERIEQERGPLLQFVEDVLSMRASAFAVVHDALRLTSGEFR